MEPRPTWRPGLPGGSTRSTLPTCHATQCISSDIVDKHASLLSGSDWPILGRPELHTSWLSYISGLCVFFNGCIDNLDSCHRTAVPKVVGQGPPLEAKTGPFPLKGSGPVMSVMVMPQ